MVNIISSIRSTLGFQSTSRDVCEPLALSIVLDTISPIPICAYWPPTVRFDPQCSYPEGPTRSDMTKPGFVSAATPLASEFTPSANVTRRHVRYSGTRRNTPTADLKLVPGVPPGEDARENAPMRYYVPRPAETYEKRGFSTILPKTWEGEIETIGVGDIPPITEESLEESKYVEVDSVANSAFVQYAQMMKAEREASLEKLKERNAVKQTGRATCGETEGRELVSNYSEILVDGVKAVEYWGVPNGAVPRLFGGPGE